MVAASWHSNHDALLLFWLIPAIQPTRPFSISGIVRYGLSSSPYVIRWVSFIPVMQRCVWNIDDAWSICIYILRIYIYTHAHAIKEGETWPKPILMVTNCLLPGNSYSYPHLKVAEGFWWIFFFNSIGYAYLTGNPRASRGNICYTNIGCQAHLTDPSVGDPEGHNFLLSQNDDFKISCRRPMEWPFWGKLHLLKWHLVIAPL